MARRLESRDDSIVVRLATSPSQTDRPRIFCGGDFDFLSHNVDFFLGGDFASRRSIARSVAGSLLLVRART
jgi:hypothetical protein